MQNSLCHQFTWKAWIIKLKILPFFSGSCEQVDCFGPQKEINSKTSSRASLGTGKYDGNPEIILSLRAVHYFEKLEVLVNRQRGVWG